MHFGQTEWAPSLTVAACMLDQPSLLPSLYHNVQNGCGLEGAMYIVLEDVMTMMPK